MQPILIFDLDGTILSVNSFPHWARYMLAGHFGGLTARERLALSLRTGIVLMERKAFGRSHCHARCRLQALWTRALEKDAAKAAMHGFNASLQGYLRPNLRSLMAAVAGKNADALLATSAAGVYAHGLGEALGFAHVLASGDTDNRGENKRDRVLAMISSQGWDNRSRVFLTDHEEDLPLIRQCRRTLWFGRDEDAPLMQASAPRAEVVACRNKTDGEVMRLASSF